MTTNHLQKLWDSLGAPLDLVEKGKYGPEKTFKWKLHERDFNGSGDRAFWQSGSEDLNDLFN